VLIRQRTGGTIDRQEGYHQEYQYDHPDDPVAFYVFSNPHFSTYQLSNL
jgi:hypothetical protein